MSQLTKIEEILKRDGRIDNFSAIHSRLTLRLGARVWDLKRRGWQFRTEQCDDKNTIYHVIAAPKPQQLAITV
jgi:Helix-turn-helix domain